jgi:ATP-binding cassette subfamily F protein uup
MQKAEDEIAIREKKMADPNLFAKDPTQFNKLAAETEKLRASIARMEEEWLELELLREQIEG